MPRNVYVEAVRWSNLMNYGDYLQVEDPERFLSKLMVEIRENPMINLNHLELLEEYGPALYMAITEGNCIFSSENLIDILKRLNPEDMNVEPADCKTALSLCNIPFYQDYNDSDWPASSLNSAEDQMRDHMKVFDHDSFFSEKATTDFDRMALALSQARGNFFYSDEALESFIRVCGEAKDLEALKVISDVAPDQFTEPDFAELQAFLTERDIDLQLAGLYTERRVVDGPLFQKR